MRILKLQWSRLIPRSWSSEARNMCSLLLIVCLELLYNLLLINYLVKVKFKNIKKILRIINSLV